MGSDRRSGGFSAHLRAAAAAALAWGALAGLLWAAGTLPPTEHRPLLVKEGAFTSPRGYVSSDACQSCHPQQYSSWHRSFHRTMTQVVSDETVMADFDGVVLNYDGQTYRLSRRDGGFWVEMPDPDILDARIAAAGRGEAVATDPIPRVERQIVQSTGLHHYQLYWYPSGNGRELFMLPFVFLSGERRWVPRVSVFLLPPNRAQPRLVWNHQCLPCHSTDGNPGYRAVETGGAVRTVADSRVVEMGIACEACHGPGKAHVEARRVGRTDVGAMVHPRRVSAAVSAQICGQCHSVNTPYTQQAWADWLLDGPSYKAGGELADSRFVVQQDTAKTSPLVRQWLDENPGRLGEWFWPDGMVRVSGREYNGLLKSPCYAGGEFSCVTCHSQHNAEPDDLLPAGMRGNVACAGCHQQIAASVSKHSHHAAGSEGSLCYNCHMPHTSYGLLKAIRSHTIDSPSAQSTIDAGRPNACNLCHLDKTLEWTARQLKEWYGQPVPRLSDEQKSVGYAPLMILKGDAGQRALIAWHMGWPPAQEASGGDWLAPYLAETLTDPYDVVRYIGGRSLATLPGFDGFRYDFISPVAARAEARDRALAAWRARMPENLQGRGDALLMGPDGVERSRFEALARGRDNRPMTLGE